MKNLFKQRLSQKWVRLLVVILMMGGMALACGESPDMTPTAAPSKAASTPAHIKPTPQASTQAPAVKESGNSRKWTVMLYQDGDDQILEEDILNDLNEAELVGSSDQVAIVSQLARFKGGFKGDGNWHGVRRYYVTQDDDLDHIHSQQVSDLGDVNMADTGVLKDYINWAMTTYPADKYVLILSDHGAGWPGGFGVPDNEARKSNELIDGFGDMIYLNQFDQAMADVLKKTGVSQFELIGMDACLMGQLEVLTAMQPYAHYAVLSQETEPSLGWAYASFLKKLVQDPDGVSGAALAKNIVSSYINDDTTIVNDARRAKYVAENYEGGDNMSAAQLANEESKSVTLSAVDLTRLPDLLSSVDDLALAMTGISQKVVARARSHTVAFESVYGDDNPSPYIDLGHFAKLIKNESTSPKIATAADAVRSAIKDAVIVEKHGKDKTGATGVTIYFPNSNLFKSDGTDYSTYTRIANRFGQTSRWPDFLTFHYTGQPFEKNNSPHSKAAIKGPGSEKLTVSPLKLSADSTTVDKTITVSTEINGSNLAYIYVFTGVVNKANGAIHVLDIDYIDADTTKEVDGVVYPDWGEERPVSVDVDWSPVQYVIHSGGTSAPALLKPKVYAADTEHTIYTSDGIYTYSDSGEQHYVRLFFNGDGALTQIIGFTGMDDTGPQHQLTPVNGDKIILLEQWMEKDADGTIKQTTHQGKTLIIGDKELTWQDARAPKGLYVVGLMAEDMDGNLYNAYANITVK